MRTALLVLAVVLAALTAGLARADDLRIQANGELVLLLPLEGTVWRGQWLDGQTVTLRFDKGGVLEYSYPLGTFRNGTWKQEGASVYMETNKKYAEFRGVLLSGRISGKASNVAGAKWTWHIQRVEERASR